MPTTHLFSWNPVPGAQAYQLYVGTRPGGYDLANSGRITQTSYLVSNLPTGSQLWARLWTLQSGSWSYSQISFRTAAATDRSLVPLDGTHSPRTIPLDPSEELEDDQARLVYPPDGLPNADPALPFEWTEVRGATYRLQVGSRPDASDLLDTGMLLFPKHFLAGLPEGRPLYATIWSYVGGEARSSSATFTLGPPSSPSDAKIAAALWATHFVRAMADADSTPFPGTVLEARTKSEGRSVAFCTDYGALLIQVLEEMNLGYPARFLNLFMNTNYYDAHTVIEMFHPLQNEWILLDPTFDMVPRRAGDGTFATASDVTRATLQMRWSDIVYVPLGSEGLQYARSYYIDYPLLYLNPIAYGQSFTPGRGNSPLPYLEPLTGPPSNALDIYMVRASGTPAIEIDVDGVDCYLDGEGIDGLSQAFAASTISTTPGTPRNLSFYRLRRFVF